ncbi:MAG: adenylyltransferase/cytidyltransferase family protein [Lentisphaeria bacterium]|nr:adenylyltransferase/cytidyltransferase family protein [Lentisphaeria bacterium]
MVKKVFVSGCYDMLHSGHVAFFEEAASYGDLYVGLGSDKTILGLKGRKTINPDAERLYMVKSIRYVKDAWINSGSGIMDFEKEVLELAPDIFFVNSDGYTPAKEEFCKKHDIELIVSKRIPSPGLPERSTTQLRQICRIPYRVELCGGWMDQPFINSIYPGSCITVSIEPDIEFNYCSGMATSSRKKAIELWQSQLPAGDPVALAKTLFCVENPPGTVHVSGSQDQLGILLPGLNKLSYNNSYWPEKIESVKDEAVLNFIEKHLYLVQLPQRPENYDVFAGKNINEPSIRKLAGATGKAWNAILTQNIKDWGRYTVECFEAQLELFPGMFTDEISKILDKYRDLLYGWKLTGSGGGGYLCLISEEKIPGSIQVRIRRN